MAVGKCVFCGKEQEDFKGFYYIKNDGSVNYYSSSKCFRNHLNLRRDRRKVRWTEAFHTTRHKKIERQKEVEAKAKEEKVVKGSKRSRKKATAAKSSSKKK